MERLPSNSKAKLLFTGYTMIFDLALEGAKAKKDKLMESLSFLERLYSSEDAEEVELESRLCFHVLRCAIYFHGDARLSEQLIDKH